MSGASVCTPAIFNFNPNFLPANAASTWMMLVFAAVVGLVWQVVVVRMALRKQYRGFRLMLLPNEWSREKSRHLETEKIYNEHIGATVKHRSQSKIEPINASDAFFSGKEKPTNAIPNPPRSSEEDVLILTQVHNQTNTPKAEEVSSEWTREFRNICEYDPVVKNIITSLKKLTPTFPFNFGTRFRMTA